MAQGARAGRRKGRPSSASSARWKPGLADFASTSIMRRASSRRGLLPGAAFFYIRSMPERQQPTARSAYRTFRVITTRWMDNDVYGHMNNVVHYSLFDTAVNGWLIEQGVLDPAGGDQVGLVVETGCRYAAEIAFPDTVHAGLRVARLGSSSVRYEIGLFRNDEPLAAAEGFFVHVYVDRVTRRPKPINPRLRAVLETIAR
jgi:acyl-CoA thioester hydrolase